MSTYKKIFSLALLFSVVAFANTQLFARSKCSSGTECRSRSRECSTDCRSRSRECSTDCKSRSRECGSRSEECSTKSRECSTDCGGRREFGRTHFTRRSITFDSTWDLSLTNYWIYHANGYINNGFCGPRSRFAFIATPFFQQSTRNRRHDNHFSTGSSGDIHQNDSLLTLNNGNDTAIGTGTLDNHNRRRRLRPESREYGAVFTFYADLGSCFCDGGWLQINTAAVGAEHKLRRCGRRESGEHNRSSSTEFNTSTSCDFITGSTTVSCETETFSCETAEVNKFRDRCRKRAGLDDIQVKLGYDYFMCNNDHAGIYLIGGIPTGRRRHEKDLFIFDPLIGTRHGSIGVGLNTDCTLWQGCTSNVNWMADFKYRFVFRAKERRIVSVDENLDVRRNECLRVEPRSTINFWTALHYQHCAWNVEVGYDLDWRGRECIRRIRNNRQNDKCNQTETLLTDVGTQISSQKETCNINTSNTNTFTNTETGEGSIHRAQHPRVLTNKIYGAFGHDTLICNYPSLFGIGASYEFAKCRGAFDHWAIFAKLGMQF